MYSFSSHGLIYGGRGFAFWECLYGMVMAAALLLHGAALYTNRLAVIPGDGKSASYAYI